MSNFDPKSIKILCKFAPKSASNPHGPMGFPPLLGRLGATFEKMMKNGSRDLIPGGLLGAKLAALGAQDGASDGQVGASWGSKWRQDGQNAALKIDRFLDTFSDRCCNGF